MRVGVVHFFTVHQSRCARLQLATVILDEAPVREEQLLAHDRRAQRDRAGSELALRQRCAPRRLCNHGLVWPAAPHRWRWRTRLQPHMNVFFTYNVSAHYQNN